jgi:hypothetical protein
MLADGECLGPTCSEPPPPLAFARRQAQHHHMTPAASTNRPPGHYAQPEQSQEKLQSSGRSRNSLTGKLAYVRSSNFWRTSSLRPAISLKAAAPNSSPQPALPYGAMRTMHNDTPSEKGRDALQFSWPETQNTAKRFGLIEHSVMPPGVCHAV